MINGRPPRLPAAVRIYAIGDIHGRLDLLLDMEQKIRDDIARSPANLRRIVIYLGDYVDRGFDSAAVLDHLSGPPLEGFERVLLLGNHDAWLRDFVDGQPAVGPSWMRFGGDATLLSYGIKIDFTLPEEKRIIQAHQRLTSKFPVQHRQFLQDLELAYGLGDYFFCHAGIRPDVALEEQGEQDLIWIREPFLSWQGECGKIIVHGHTIEEQPVLRHNRIGIDTGACFTANLTCLVLEEDTIRFLSTGATPPDT
ncbi:MAG: serine/threonine protein phosphatase [Geminicoccaceae bacterium]|nr:serine/threonine protein phosphatase [Geminicoccaceae bacterium]MCB9942638.1 serine/threonine protein phosphatase [Geminicoccaceae bacterium]